MICGLDERIQLGDDARALAGAGVRDLALDQRHAAHRAA